MEYVDNIDATVTLTVCDNADGENIILNLDTDTLDTIGIAESIGIALSAAQVFALVDELRVLAAGI